MIQVNLTFFIQEIKFKERYIGKELAKYGDGFKGCLNNKKSAIQL